MKELRYNEDSWKVDVISEINKYLVTKQISITRASGEYTIKGINRFPDVILFGGHDGSQILQGWELKMPDTAITDDDPLLLAEEKARTLGLNSFTVWNASEAAVYIRDESDEYVRIKTWNNPEIKCRKDVEDRKDIWIKTLHDMIDSINNLLNGREIKSIYPIDTFNEATYSKYIGVLSPYVHDEIANACRKDNKFLARINQWWDSNKDDYSKMDKIKTLSKIVIINWINKFIFAHYLKQYYDVAYEVDCIDETTSLPDAQDIFKNISKKCNVSIIFSESLGDECLGEYPWLTMIELNKYLKTIKIDSISQETIQPLLSNVISISKRGISGQYCTPPLLAKLLVRLALSDATGESIDPCCGTGTIAREIISYKKERGIKNPYDTTWASDKFQHPLKIATLSLFDPVFISTPVQIFEQDVFSLSCGNSITFSNNSGFEITKTIPKFKSIISNLPFVGFEDAEKTNPNVVKMGLEDTKSDLYAYILLNLKKILSEDGRIGVITSNSWIGTEWGKKFREILQQEYIIESIIMSQSGRWFNNAEVVTTILILKNKPENFCEDYSINFISIADRIEYWANDDIMQELIDNILLENEDSEHIYIRKYTLSQINKILDTGFGLMCCFTDASWILDVTNKVIPVSKRYEIARGERRGWDELFYPKKSIEYIEDEFIKPVLLSSKNLKSLEIEAMDRAFCCSEGLENLEKQKKTGALRWITMFIDKTNTTGVPLTKTLSRSGMHWYEMSASTLADLAISMNPNNKLCVYKLKKRSFVNQRLIRLTTKTGKNIELDHALMNTALGMLLIESLGFGRGLGVLDLSATRLKKQYVMLNPNLLSDQNIKNILNSFKTIKEREPLEIDEELKQDDRRLFDYTVLNAYGISHLQNKIYESLLELYHIRKAVEVNKQKVVKPVS